MPCAPQWIDIKALLSRVPLFEGMPPDGLARLTRATREIHTQRSATLFRKDEVCSGLYLLVYGRVKLFFSTQQGCEKILDILVQGDAFCESTMFLGKNYQVYAQTLSDCFLMHISKTAILAELENDPALARRIIDSLSRGIFERNAEIESYTLHSGRQRVIHFLLREMAGARRNDPHEPDEVGTGREEDPLLITLTTSKNVIASRLNLTQEHFSRILHELSACGLIFVEGRNIYVIDTEQLRIAAA